MGIEGLFVFLEKQNAGLIKECTDLKEFSGKIFAIDITGFIVAYNHVANIVASKTQRVTR